jgi:hypothetical protein
MYLGKMLNNLHSLLYIVLYTHFRYCVFKAVCLQIHANIHENFEKAKYFEVNNRSNLHIAYNLPNKVKLCKYSPNCVSHAVKINMLNNTVKADINNT